MAETVELQEGDEIVIFREIQRMRELWAWMALAILGVLLLFTGLGVLVVLPLAIVFYHIRLITEVREDGIYVRYAPRHRSFRRIPFIDVERCEVTKVGRLTYGGPGAIWTPNFIAYTTGRGEGVKLYRENAKPVVIGTQRADELMAAITEQV